MLIFHQNPVICASSLQVELYQCNIRPLSLQNVFCQISDLKQRGILGFGRSRSWEWDLAAFLCVDELNLYSMCFF